MLTPIALCCSSMIAAASDGNKGELLCQPRRPCPETIRKVDPASLAGLGYTAPLGIRVAALPAESGEAKELS